MTNVNDSYFDGHYKEIWRSLIPPELTRREVEFIVSHFGINENSFVLDVMCGYGRHALELGRKGVEVAAFDNLPAYIDEINFVAENENLPVKGHTKNIMDLGDVKGADLAICMGNSICFFNHNHTISIFQSINRALKIDGKFLINTWALAEIAFKEFVPRSWNQIGDLKFLVESKFLLQPSRIESVHYIISDDQDKETKHAVDYIYSLNETEKMLNTAGFDMSEVYSIPGRKRFSLGDQRAYIVATKRS